MAYYCDFTPEVGFDISRLDRIRGILRDHLIEV